MIDVFKLCVGILFIKTINYLPIFSYMAIAGAGNKTFKTQVTANWLSGFLLDNGSFAMDMYFFLR